MVFEFVDRRFGALDDLQMFKRHIVGYLRSLHCGSELELMKFYFSNTISKWCHEAGVYCPELYEQRNQFTYPVYLYIPSSEVYPRYPAYPMYISRLCQPVLVKCALCIPRIPCRPCLPSIRCCPCLRAPCRPRHRPLPTPPLTHELRRPTTPLAAEILKR